ncbi:MAG: DUF2284 domain-containing protein [Clostridiales bacterium]|nr:DUF2284 domain-containing protein [Clostridiales bacterium]
MCYDSQALIEEAEGSGFSHAGVLNTAALIFMPEVREMCSVDRCRQYNRNWRCPPACGSIEDAAARASEYSFGIIVQTVGQMEDDFDIECIEETGKKHNENFASLVEKLKKRHPDMLPMGAGTCRLCEECTYPNSACRHPDKSISSMEAYGLWVSKVCEQSNVPYYYGKNSIAYTSCYLLK